MKCKKMVGLLLAVVMILGLLPLSALAAGTEIGTTTNGEFVDTNADPDKSYEYTVTGSDGSTETVTVPAVGAEPTGNRVTEQTGSGAVYYQKVTDPANASGEGYLLVANKKAVTHAPGLEAVTVTGDRINGEHANAEWHVTKPADGKLNFASGNKALSMEQIQDGSGSRRNPYTYSYNVVLGSKDGNNQQIHASGETIKLSRTYYEPTRSWHNAEDYPVDVYLKINGDAVTADKKAGSATAFTLYQKQHEPAGTRYIVDTTGLNEQIAAYEAEHLVADNYTKASWDNYQAALTDAKAQQNPTERFAAPEEAEAKLAEVNAAHKALIEAHDALAYDNTKPIVTTPEISWTRTQDNDNQTAYLSTFVNSSGSVSHQGTRYDKYTALTWDWNEIKKLVNDQERKQPEVWNYKGNQRIEAAKITSGGGDWTHSRVHKISGEFVWPADYDLNDTTIILQSVNDQHYQPIYDYINDNGLAQYFPNGKVLPVNDDVYVVMWVENPDGSGKPTAANINDYLAFWTGTSGKGIWSKNGTSGEDWGRTEPATFLESSQQGVRSFYRSWPNAVGAARGLTNKDVVDMSPEMQDLLGQTDGWYTLTDTTAINSVMRNNYKDGIPAGAKVHLDLYVHNNSSEGGIDKLEIKLEKQPAPLQDITVNYYFGAVTNPTDANNFLGSSTLLNHEVGEEITLLPGTNAGMLNHMKAKAIAKATQAVSDGAQQGTVPYVVVEGENVINVLYTASGTNNKVFTYDFGTTNVYENIYRNKTFQVREGTQIPAGMEVDTRGHKITYKPQNPYDRYATLHVDVTDSGETYPETVYVISASNVLYEEDFVNVKGAAAPDDVKWTAPAAAINHGTVSDNAATAYGYSDAYSRTTGENGVYSANVSADSMFSEELQFKFHGTGFDLISVCGPNTGALTVRVDDASGKYVKSFVVDTVLRDDNKTFYQVPVVHEQGLQDGTYTVTVSGAYLERTAPAARTMSVGSSQTDLLLERLGLSEDQLDTVEFISMDNQVNAASAVSTFAAAPRAAGEQSVYVDGFRVYRPTDNISYAKDEKNMIYTNVMDEAIQGDFYAYVEQDTATGQFTTANYESLGGPENELYLPAGTGVVFGANGAKYAQASLRAVNGATEYNNTAISHNTEMYYKLDVKNGMITIANTGSDLLAIGNLKTDKPVTSIQDKAPAVRAVAAMFAAPVEPEKPQAPDQFQVSFVLTDGAVWTDGTTDSQRFTLTADDGLTAPALKAPQGKKLVGWQAAEIDKLLKDREILTVQYLQENYDWTGKEPVITFQPVFESESGAAFEPARFDLKAHVSGLFNKRVTLTAKTSTDVACLTVNGQKVTPNNAFLVKIGLADHYTFKASQTVRRSGTVTFDVVAYDAHGNASTTRTITK